MNMTATACLNPLRSKSKSLIFSLGRAGFLILLCLPTAQAEFDEYPTRQAFEQALDGQALFVESFDRFTSDTLLDLGPWDILGGSALLSGTSSHNAATYIDSAPTQLGRFGTNSADFDGAFIIAEINHSPSLEDPSIGRGIIRLEIPQLEGQFPAVGFDFSGATGGLSDGIALTLTYRITTADGSQNTGPMPDLNSDGIADDDGFIGFTDFESPIVSLELYNSTPYGMFEDDGDGEVYGIDNLTLALLDGDADGLPDSFELAHGLDLTLPDADADGDNDGLTNAQEFYQSTSPLFGDTDADGFTDGSEVAKGSDPTDRNSPTPFDLIVNFTAISPDLDFAARTFPAFDRSITVTPAWPETSNPGVRLLETYVGDAEDEWTPVTTDGNIELLRDFLGVDSRTSEGGNGAYDGIDGLPSPLTLTLGSLPPGKYRWMSFHHDLNRVHAEFQTEISTDDGNSFRMVGRYRMTHSPKNGEPLWEGVRWGSAPEILPSTVNIEFEVATGDKVVVRFTPLHADGARDLQVFGINGFKLSQLSGEFLPLAITSVIPDPDGESVSITWNSKSGRYYAIERSPDLLHWLELDDQVPGEAGVTSFLDGRVADGAPGKRFYRVRLAD